jgi:patatin-related protein
VPEVDAVAAEAVDLRLAVVLYGGVSLAVYMAGVVEEILACVRATARDDAPVDELSAVYRAAADASGIARVAVDVLTGASAGAIDAIFLAKALAQRGSLAAIRDLWQREADAALLIADRSARTPLLARRPLPASLLDGDRLTQRLFEALAATPDGERGWSEQIDLFVTVTDLRGIPAPLAFADEVVWERRHRQWLHLRHDERDGGRRDFDAACDPLLAFAGRATSALPLAFAPARLRDVAALAAAWDPLRHGAAPERSAAWAAAFAVPGGDAPGTPHVDGGVLDNKPLALATEALTRRRAGRGARRALLLIEPRPADHAHPATDPATPLAAALAAATLPYHETIREDVEGLLARNRQIARLQAITAGALADREAALRAGGEAASAEAGTLSEFARSSVARLIERHGLGPAYGGYHRLQVAALTDRLARDAAAEGASSEALARLRAEVVVPWRRARYRRDGAMGGGFAPTAAFVAAFDLGFPYRRLSFVLESIAALRAEIAAGAAGEGVRRAAVERVREALGVSEAAFERGSAAFARRLRRVEGLCEVAAARLAQAKAPGAVIPPTDPSPEAFAAWAEGERRRVAVEIAAAARVGRALYPVVGGLRWSAGVGSMAPGSSVPGSSVPGSSVPGPMAAVAAARVATAWIADVYADFPRVDLVRFPVIVAAAIGDELAAVEVVRCSPRSATAIVDEANAAMKLAGARWAGFGAFVDAQGRARDAVWGRLDAAERLVALLAPAESRAALIARAHDAILRSEEVTREGLRAAMPERRSRWGMLAMAARLLRAALRVVVLSRRAKR